MTEIPEDLLQAAVEAMARRTSPEGIAYAPESWWVDDMRAVLAATLPLHEAQVRERVAAEREQQRQDALAKAERDFQDAWAAGHLDGGAGVRILPDGALAWRRHTPEQRRAYLTEHRDEALAYGVPADLVDLMIGDAEESVVE